MVQEAVDQTPLISPTDGESESDLWDAAFPDEGDEAGTEDSGGEEPQSTEASEGDEEDSGESESDGTDDEHPEPQSPAEAEQRRLNWAISVARDPNAISQVPKRQRKAVMTAVKMANGIVPALAQEQAVWLAEQRVRYLISLSDKANELDIIAEDDPTRFQRILSGAEPQDFSEDAIQQWRQIRQWRESGSPVVPQNGGQTPQQQQPQVDPQAVRWANRATAALDEFGEEFGEQAVNDVRVWLEEEGLMRVRTGQEAEAGFRALKAHLDEVRSPRSGPPPAVQRRKGLPKPDVSPGHVDVSGRASKDEMNRRSFGPGSTESDAWDAVG